LELGEPGIDSLCLPIIQNGDGDTDGIGNGNGIADCRLQVEVCDGNGDGDGDGDPRSEIGAAACLSFWLTVLRLHIIRAVWQIGSPANQSINRSGAWVQLFGCNL